MLLRGLDMTLTKYKLGDLISLSEEKNTDLKYGLDDVKGVSIQKKFIETKADMVGVSLHPYLLVKPDFFAYVPITSRNGNKITLAHNDTEKTYIVSSSYIVFYIKEPQILNSAYLFMYFNRPEFDRYSRFNSWGSAREAFSWEEMCDINIELPPIAVQEKYVNIYKAMVENQKVYETGLEDLKLVCDAYIENLRRNMPCEEIGKYIRELNNKNTTLNCVNVKGVNKDSLFCETKTTTDNLDFSKYKIVKYNDFAYNPSRINLGSIALYRDNLDCIVSPMYTIFNIIDAKKMMPEYLMMWLSRKEFHRSTLFYAGGSVRDSFDFDVMKKVKIPVPDIKIQQSIVDIYNVYIERKEINEKLKQQIKELCPILIRGSLQN